MEGEDVWLEELGLAECLALLRNDRVGRIAIVVNDAPIVIPVNYQLVTDAERNWVAIRSRPGGILDRTPAPVAFEIDGVDTATRTGWSVLVRGTLLVVDPDAADFRERFDPKPWVTDQRDVWYAIEPFSITGRRLRRPDAGWPFHTTGYL